MTWKKIRVDLNEFTDCDVDRTTGVIVLDLRLYVDQVHRLNVNIT